MRKATKKSSSPFLDLPSKVTKRELLEYLICLEPFGMMKASKMASKGVTQPKLVLGKHRSCFGEEHYVYVLGMKTTIQLLKLMVLRRPISGPYCLTRLKKPGLSCPKGCFSIDFKLWDSTDAEIVFYGGFDSSPKRIKKWLDEALEGKSFPEFIDGFLDQYSSYLAERLLQARDIKEILNLQEQVYRSSMNPDALADKILNMKV